MKKINVLNKHIAQLIAAGEVVERPACALKELVENSIDSGATRITAEIKNGGIKLIKVSDNGSGIYKDDVQNAFLRHATSKLQSAEDLNNINSLGFRGEALASICAVSRTEIITKSKEETSGIQFFVEAGVPGKLTETGCTDGTVILIKDLFYNTPARMKFLKKDVAEANACAGVIDKLALSHPEISFKFIRDKKEALFTPGDGKISSVIYSLYGKDFFEGMIPVDYELGSIKVLGFVSRPSAARSSRSMQNFFINSRYVKSKVGSSALEEAFKNSVMTGKFPYCVIYITISPSFVDVNVHPSKTEVKFIDEKAIFEAIYYGVKNTLINNPGQGIILNDGGESIFSRSSLKDTVDFYSNIPKLSGFKNKSNTLSKENPTSLNSFFSKIKEKSETYEKQVNAQGSENFKKGYIFEKPSAKEPEDNTSCENSCYNLKEVQKQRSQTAQNRPESIEQDSFCSSFKEKDMRIIGEVFDCYIIIQFGNELILVDKHAAHERIIFENLKENKGNGESQTLLEPVIVTLEKEEYGALLQNPDLISKAGYAVEDFGSGTVIVRGVPMYISVKEVPGSITEIANYIIKGKKTVDTKKLDWLYHNIACRSAVKGGKSSSGKEITALIRKLLENPSIQHCPHGRPVYVNVSRKFIEKQFGRV